MVPITQAAAGYLFLLGAVLIFIGGFTVRWFLGRRRDSKLVSSIVRLLRQSAFARGLLGGLQSDVPTDDDLDGLVLAPTMLLGSVCACAGIGLVAADMFGIRFVLFRL